jgi:hypothetical protein
MSEKVESLEKKEYNTVGEMLVNLISQCPVITSSKITIPVKYQYADTGVCLSIYTLPGAKYLKKNVMGGFTAQVKFQIAYKGFGTSNQKIVDAQAFVDSIMDWLEDSDNLPALSDNRTITNITSTNSVAYADEAGSDGSIVFAADATMEYEAE